MFVGDSTTASTTALLLHYEEGEGASSTLFYQGVMKFYIAAVKKLLKVYDPFFMLLPF